jgi:hypothetical protein
MAIMSNDIVDEAPTVLPKVALSVAVTGIPGMQLLQLAAWFQVPFNPPVQVESQTEYPVIGTAVSNVRANAFFH